MGTETSTANQITSGTTPIANSTAGLSFKDKATLIISIIALIISASTFVIGRLDARASKSKEAAALEIKQKSQNYKAYSLGQQVVRTFVFWFEVPKGETDPQKLAKAKEFGAFEVSKLQQLSDLLDLRISDVRILFTSPDPTSSETEVDPSQPFNEIADRIRIANDKRTLAAYEVGYASLLMYVRSKGYADRPEAAQSVLQSYPQIADGINHNLSELGIQKSVSNHLSTLPEITKEMADLKEYLEDLWSH
jgi:hypothetical protein